MNLEKRVKMSEPEPTDLPDLSNSPANWRGEELLADDDWTGTWTTAEIAELERELFATDAKGMRVGDDLTHDNRLPGVAAKLARIQERLENGRGACLLRGLPIARYDEQQSRRLFWTLAYCLGTPVSQSATGDKIFSVRDEGYRLGDPQARGPNTRKRLSFHTDRCDVIAFLCLQQAKTGGENQLVSSVALYQEMSKRRPDLVRVLMQPFYYRRHNVDTGNQRPWCRQPIFSFCEGHFAASYLRVLIDRAHELAELPDLSAVQLEAMAFLEELAEQPEMQVTFHQQPGDILLLNNWVTLHRRTEFADHEEPVKRRHLLRIWLAVPNSRPLDPLFADNYGATAAGAIRGGMQASCSESSRSE